MVVLIFSLIALVWMQITKLRRRKGISKVGFGGALILLTLITSVGAIARRQTVSHEQAVAVLEGLLHNVYRAFDHRDESDRPRRPPQA